MSDQRARDARVEYHRHTPRLDLARIEPLDGALAGVTPDLGRLVEVVGVQHEKVQLSNYRGPDKESIFIPYTTAGQLWNTEYLDVIVYQAVSPTLDARTTREVTNLMASRFRFNPSDDRAVRTFGSAETQKIVGPIVLGLKIVLTFIGVLTLAIGGVGVMNIMFVSVTERTREIGIRKALGARRGAILLQFLLEGVATAVAGGIWTFTVNGTTVPTSSGTAAQQLAAVIAASLGAGWMPAGNGSSATLQSALGIAPVNVGPLAEQRSGASLEAPSASGDTRIDGSVHYSTLTFDLGGGSGDTGTSPGTGASVR